MQVPLSQLSESEFVPSNGVFLALLLNTVASYTIEYYFWSQKAIQKSDEGKDASQSMLRNLSQEIMYNK